MGSCVSKKAARAGAGAGARGNKVAAPLPAAEKESARHALPPVAEAHVEEEEVKEVVLSETPVPRPPRPPPPEPELIKRSKEQPEADEAASEACSASDTASVESAAKEKAMAKLQKPGVEREAEKRAVSDAPTKKGRTAPEERERESKPRGGGGGAGTGRARSPSPSSTHRRQQPGGGQQHPPAPRPRREHPPVVSGIGCRSGRFSPSAARRAAESVVRRTHSAREADMALPSKRSLSAAINGVNAGGYGGGGGALSRRDPGERSGRRSDSPTGSRRAPASPSAIHRPASPMRKAAKEHGTPERASRPRVRDGGDEHPAALAGLGGERKKVAEGEEGAALGQNPSVAMECFIFL
ncbi:uncharacterized protein [Setaria viridis]|uniref:Uncharacterized protein n=1 Tax=Setaria viridis TaxID=4556 RepID=A0A4U6SWL7_SETVI|nr:hypothetical protein SEVIR_9G178100v2 [Setaria viridis]